MHARSRQGFTLLEVLLAVILIDVGLLALVAGSTVLVRQAAELRVRGAALRAATNRLELLGSAACTPGTGAANGPFGLHESWSIEPPQNDVGELRDSVTFDARGQTHSIVLRTRLPC